MLADFAASARVRRSVAVSALRNVAGPLHARRRRDRRRSNERRAEESILQREIKLTKIRKNIVSLLSVVKPP
jgi:hypothetical protein